MQAKQSAVCSHASLQLHHAACMASHLQHAPLQLLDIIHSLDLPSTGFCNRGKHFQEAVGSFQEALGSFQEAVGSFQEAVGSFQEALGSFQEALGSFQEAAGYCDRGDIFSVSYGLFAVFLTFPELDFATGAIFSRFPMDYLPYF